MEFRLCENLNCISKRKIVLVNFGKGKQKKLRTFFLEIFQYFFLVKFNEN